MIEHLYATALEARDPCCVVPGCGQTFGLEIDHVDDWHLTRRTELDRLARMCWHHHDLKTRGLATLERLEGGRWRDTVRGATAREGPPREPPRETGDWEARELTLAG